MDAQATTFFHGGSHALHTAKVTFDARQTAFVGPATVAIHDDGDVSRHPSGVEPGRREPLKRFHVEFANCRRRAHWVIVCARSGPTEIVRMDAFRSCSMRAM